MAIQVRSGVCTSSSDFRLSAGSRDQLDSDEIKVTSTLLTSNLPDPETMCPPFSVGEGNCLFSSADLLRGFVRLSPYLCAIQVTDLYSY